jgi:hypothetical protein
MSPTVLDKWFKKVTTDDTGLTRRPDAVHVSEHKDEVRSIGHGYFQSQLRVSVYREVDRPTHDSIKRQPALVSWFEECFPSLRMRSTIGMTREPVTYF